MFLGVCGAVVELVKQAIAKNVFSLFRWPKETVFQVGKVRMSQAFDLHGLNPQP